MGKEVEKKQINKLVETDGAQFTKGLGFDVEAIRNKMFEAERSIDTHVPTVSLRFDTEGRELF